MVELQIRWAVPEDAAGVAEVHVVSWQGAYIGLIPQETLDALSVEQRTPGWRDWIVGSLANRPFRDESVVHRMLVAEQDNQIVGWVTFGPARDADGAGYGEVAGLYVHPNYWSQRVGHALITGAEQELMQAGSQQAYLWTLDGNERAIRFYEMHGWHADGGEKLGEAGGCSGLREVRHVRRFS